MIADDVPRFGDHFYTAPPVDNHALLVALPQGGTGSFNHTEPSITYLERGDVWFTMDGFSGRLAGGGLLVMPAGVRAFSASAQTRAISVGLGTFGLAGRHAVQPAFVPLGVRARRDWLERTLAFVERPDADRTELSVALDRLLADDVETRERRRHELLDGILSTLQSNTERAFTLAELGDRFGYAPNYLNEIVTRTTGRSLRQWQIGFRMEMARQLLKTPRLPASRVAIEIGMDAPHFTRSFATRYGMTPSIWRKSVFGGTNIDPLIDEINASGVVSIAE